MLHCNYMDFEMSICKHIGLPQKIKEGTKVEIRGSIDSCIFMPLMMMMMMMMMVVVIMMMMMTKVQI